MLRAVIILYLFLSWHPVHVSLASVDYDEKAGSFKMFLKVYTDDLENDCRIITRDHELMLYDSELMPDRSVIQRYIDDRIVFTAGDKLLKGILGNIEADAEEVRISVDYSFRDTVSTFRIRNTIMTDLFADQVNLLIFKMGSFEEGYKFTPSDTEVIIKRNKPSY